MQLSTTRAPRLRALRSAMPYLAALALGLAAFLPRVIYLGRFITNDEANFWMRRSAQFLDAVRAGDYAATAITTHPGVTTMWLGSAGILLSQALGAAQLVPPTFAARLALMQLPVALTHALAVLIGYRLLRRMLPMSVALLAGLLWALDPFVIGFSRLLHVDALAGTFLTLSMLAACVAWHHDRRTRWVVVSGLFAGLGVLSKSPALVVFPAVGAIGLAAAWRERADHGWRRQVGRLLLWGLVCAATVVAFYPALWVNLLRPYALIREGVEVEGAEPHMLGNFFLGREDLAPGPLFYPVAVALRLTPWALLGILLLPWAWRRARSATRHDLAALACMAVLFVVALSFFPKKFNRYLVPIFPSLDILAAVGIWDFGFWIFGRINSKSKIQNPKLNIGALWVGIVATLAIANAVWWRTYALDYYNTALGGHAAGVYAFSAGWGEGLEQAAQWLNAQPDITGVLIASTQVPTLQPYLRPGAQSVTPPGPLPQQTGYAVIYIYDVQAGPPWPPFDAIYGKRAPIYSVRVHGVEYAWIYQVPPPVELPLQADFADGIRLRGSQLVAPAERGQAVRLKLFWEATDAPRSGHMLFAHLIGPDGKRYAQADLPYETDRWEARRYYASELALPLPDAAPDGCYQLAIGLYDPASGQRLPLTTPQPIDPALDGPDALSLRTLCVR